jgi:hypothetical protein
MPNLIDEEVTMAMHRVKLYRPSGSLIGEAEVPDIRPGLAYRVLIWDGRTFVQQTEVSPTIYREVPRWHIGKLDVAIAPVCGQEDEAG